MWQLFSISHRKWKDSGGQTFPPRPGCQLSNANYLPPNYLSPDYLPSNYDYYLLPNLSPNYSLHSDKAIVPRAEMVQTISEPNSLTTWRTWPQVSWTFPQFHRLETSFDVTWADDLPSRHNTSPTNPLVSLTLLLWLFILREQLCLLHFLFVVSCYSW